MSSPAMSLNSAADLENGLNKDSDKQTKDVKKDSISWIKRPCLWVALGKVNSLNSLRPNAKPSLLVIFCYFICFQD